MDLKLKDVVELLQVSEKTIYRWIKEKKIPAYRINHQYRFNRSELNEWILNNRIATNHPFVAIPSVETHLADLIETGGIFYDIEGDNIQQILRNCIYSMNTPEDVQKEDILLSLLNREELMPTAIGKGVALPHTRNPIITEIEDASISICFLKKPFDYHALDGKPVSTLFIILTYNPRRHLEVLSKISFLCQDDDFIDKLNAKAESEALIKFIREKEIEWQKLEGNK